MSENCKDCLQVETLKSEVSELKIKVDFLNEKINRIEKDTAINQEQTKMVFKILTEIKDSIEKISNKIDEIESRPSKLLYSVAGGIIVAIIMVGFKFIGK
jgi:predicted transcriptional regulator